MENFNYFKTSNLEDGLFYITDPEKIRYKMSEKFESAEPGENIDPRDIFGDTISADEYKEFLKKGLGIKGKTVQTKDELDKLSAKLEKGPRDIDYLKIGNAYADGTFVEQDYSKSFQYFTKAAEMGNTDAMSMIAGSYLQGLGVEEDITKAIEWLKKAIIIDGNPLALLQLALLYLEGNGVEKDEKLAFYFMERSAKQGYGVAQYNVAVAYQNGDGVEEDMEKVLYWCERSACNDFENALAFMSNHCQATGDLVGEYHWTVRLAELGNPIALYNLGVYYRDGKMLEKNPVNAFEMFMKAAEMDYPPAQYELALCLAQGIGCDQDRDKCLEYLSKSVDAQYYLAEYNVARSIWNIDRERALMLMQDAAEQGYEPAEQFLQENE